VNFVEHFLQQPLVLLKGFTSFLNTVLHPWLQQELSVILTDLPLPDDLPPQQMPYSR
jgi:hypothetical protein